VLKLNIFLKLLAKFHNDQVHYGLGFSSNGSLQSNLFPGAIYNFFQMNIYVQIYGSNEVYTVYDLNDTIKVIPDITTDLNFVEQRLISSDSSFLTNILLHEDSSRNLESLQEIQIITGLLNQQSLSDQLGLMKFNNKSDLTFPPIYGPLANYEGVLPVK